MKYRQPFGASDPEASYVNGNPAIGLKGSIIDGRTLEEVQRELVDFIAKGGLTPSFADLGQLAKAAQTGKITYAVADGTADAIAATLSPVPAAYVAGMRVLIKVAHTNTGAVTLALNGLGAKPVIKIDGAALVAGDLVAGQLAFLAYDGTAFQVVGGLKSFGFRPALTINTTLYVNGTTGDDAAYDGSAATVSGSRGPFKTIGRAVTEAWKFGPGPFTMTIQVAAGTYAEAVLTPSYAGPDTVINGASTAGVIVSSGEANSIRAVGPNRVTVTHLTVQNSGAAGTWNGFSADDGATLITDQTASNAIGNTVFSCSGGGRVIAGTHTYRGNSTAMWAAHYSATFTFGLSSTHTFQALTVSGAAVQSVHGTIDVDQASPPGFANPGNVTGKKFDAQLNAIVNTKGRGASYFPGTVAGTTTTGAQYA